MGNSGSSGRRRSGSSGRDHQSAPPSQAAEAEVSSNRYVFAAATPFPPQYQNPNAPPYYPFRMDANLVNGRYPCGPVMTPPAPYVEHQTAVTIRNDVNLKKETLRIEADEANPGNYLVCFTFDATVPGSGSADRPTGQMTMRTRNLPTLDIIPTLLPPRVSMTVIFFAKEGEDCIVTPMMEALLPPVTVQFQRGLAQKFRQPCGTGIDLSMFEEAKLSKEGDMDVFPLVIKAEASRDSQRDTVDGCTVSGHTNSQITQAVFEKSGEPHVRIVKQILWVNGMRYELQEIYGIGNSVEEDEFDGNDPGKECVICLSEPRDTTVLPCRHMCMCSGCAKVLRFQTNRCPICRQPVERLLEIKISADADAAEE